MALFKVKNRKFFMYESNHIGDYILKSFSFKRCYMCKATWRKGKRSLIVHLRKFDCPGKEFQCCGHTYRHYRAFTKHREDHHDENYEEANTVRKQKQENLARDYLGPFNIPFVKASNNKHYTVDYKAASFVDDDGGGGCDSDEEYVVNDDQE